MCGPTSCLFAFRTLPAPSLASRISSSSARAPSRQGTGTRLRPAGKTRTPLSRRAAPRGYLARSLRWGMTSNFATRIYRKSRMRSPVITLVSDPRTRAPAARGPLRSPASCAGLGGGGGRPELAALASPKVAGRLQVARLALGRWELPRGWRMAGSGCPRPPVPRPAGHWTAA